MYIEQVIIEIFKNMNKKSARGIDYFFLFDVKDDSSSTNLNSSINILS